MSKEKKKLTTTSIQFINSNLLRAFLEYGINQISYILLVLIWVESSSYLVGTCKLYLKLAFNIPLLDGQLANFPLITTINNVPLYVTVNCRKLFPYTMIAAKIITYIHKITN